MRFLIIFLLLIQGGRVMAYSEAEEFGTFSVSLGVDNMNDSKDFYEKLGFSKIVGEPSQGWLILKKGDVIIGLFTEFKTGPGFLTFNPKDVRAVQRDLKSKGFVLMSKLMKIRLGQLMLYYLTLIKIRLCLISTKQFY
jgi:hypothetical protein